MIFASGRRRKLLVPLALCLVACSGEEDRDPPGAAQVSMFTGRLETADAVVGLAVSEWGNVYAYVCGGETTFTTHSRWFAGSAAPGSAPLENDGFRLDVTLRGEETDITLTAPDGAVHTTLAERAGAGSRSAVYESSADAECPWGVVVIDDGGVEPEVHGTWCGRIEAAEVFAQVTPVRPMDFSRDILPVLANTPAGEVRFEVRRAGASPAAP